VLPNEELEMRFYSITKALLLLVKVVISHSTLFLLPIGETHLNLLNIGRYFYRIVKTTFCNYFNECGIQDQMLLLCCFKEGVLLCYKSAD